MYYCNFVVVIILLVVSCILCAIGTPLPWVYFPEPFSRACVTMGGKIRLLEGPIHSGMERRRLRNSRLHDECANICDCFNHFIWSCCWNFIDIDDHEDPSFGVWIPLLCVFWMHDNHRRIVCLSIHAENLRVSIHRCRDSSAAKHYPNTSTFHG